MCGRYTLSVDHGGRIAERFDVREFPSAAAGLLHRFNVCPGEQVVAVDAERRVRALTWGLSVPGHKLPAPINARAETAAARPLFAALIASAEGRCLVPADGWYEWLRAERPGGERVPFRYTVDGGAPFAFAGLWDDRRLGSERVASAAVLTTTANAVCAPVHDRMPCVLAGPDDEAAWLSGDLAAEELRPLPAARTAVAPANPAVNRAGVEGAELLDSAPTPPEQLPLGV